MFLDESLTRALSEEMSPLALPMGEIRARVRRRRLRRRSSIIGGLVLVLLVGGGVVTERGLGEPLTTVQFTSFKTPGPPHLLNREIGFGYLPSGFSLVSDQQVNKTTKPADYQRSVVYQGGTAGSPEQISLNVEQSSQVGLLSNLPTSNTFEQYAFTSIRGHKALAVTASDHVYGQVSYSYVGGQMHESISCSGPVNAPASQIDPACRTMFSGSQNRPTGPGLAGIPVPSSAFPVISLQWIERHTVSFTLVGHGLALSALEKVANGIKYNPSIGNCIVNGRSLGSGDCAPGITGSPPVDSSLVPSGGVELASGTAAGHQWALSADFQKGNVWVDLGYAGQSRNGYWFSSTSASPSISLKTADNGQRFLFGMMPDSVTSFQAAVPGGRKLTMGMLPAKIDGWSFFVLPLGEVSGKCNMVCVSPVDVTFYSGRTVVYSSTWKSDASFMGVPLR